MTDGTTRDRWRTVLAVLGVLLAGNGVWMLLRTEGWFQCVAPDVAPFNLHFVRDVGAAYLTAGAALCWAGLRPLHRGPLVGVAALFLCLHALGHVRETLSGDLGPPHWLEDQPGVYAPAVLVLYAALRCLRAPVSRS
jgi:hypothetical protein